MSDKIRPTDGRAPRRKYSDQDIRRARLQWCLLGNADEVDRIMGLPPSSTSAWKRRQRPDGQDWDEFREELGMADYDRVVEMLGPQTEVEARKNIYIGAHKMDARCNAAIAGEKKSDTSGGLWPENFYQAAIGKKTAAQIMEHQIARLGEVQDETQRRERDAEIIVNQMLELTEEVLGRVHTAKLREALENKAAGSLLGLPSSEEIGEIYEDDSDEPDEPADSD